MRSDSRRLAPSRGRDSCFVQPKKRLEGTGSQQYAWHKTDARPKTCRRQGLFCFPLSSACPSSSFRRSLHALELVAALMRAQLQRENLNVRGHTPTASPYKCFSNCRVLGGEFGTGWDRQLTQNIVDESISDLHMAELTMVIAHILHTCKVGCHIKGVSYKGLWF